MFPYDLFGLGSGVNPDPIELFWGRAEDGGQLGYFIGSAEVLLKLSQNFLLDGFGLHDYYSFLAEQRILFCEFDHSFGLFLQQILHIGEVVIDFSYFQLIYYFGLKQGVFLSQPFLLLVFHLVKICEVTNEDTLLNLHRY